MGTISSIPGQGPVQTPAATTNAAAPQETGAKTAGKKGGRLVTLSSTLLQFSGQIKNKLGAFLKRGVKIQTRNISKPANSPKMQQKMAHLTVKYEKIQEAQQQKMAHFQERAEAFQEKQSSVLDALAAKSKVHGKKVATGSTDSHGAKRAKGPEKQASKKGSEVTKQQRQETHQQKTQQRQEARSQKIQVRNEAIAKKTEARAQSAEARMQHVKTRMRRLEAGADKRLKSLDQKSKKRLQELKSTEKSLKKTMGAALKSKADDARVAKKKDAAIVKAGRHRQLETFTQQISKATTLRDLAQIKKAVIAARKASTITASNSRTLNNVIFNRLNVLLKDRQYSVQFVAEARTSIGSKQLSLLVHNSVLEEALLTTANIH